MYKKGDPKKSRGSGKRLFGERRHDEVRAVPNEMRDNLTKSMYKKGDPKKSRVSGKRLFGERRHDEVRAVPNEMRDNLTKSMPTTWGVAKW